MEFRRLDNFLRVAAVTGSFNTVHVSIYTVLLHYWEQSGFAGSFSVSRKQVMQLAKIKSIVTYHKCMHELIEAGMIDYVPSYNKYKKTIIVLK